MVERDLDIVDRLAGTLERTTSLGPRGRRAPSWPTGSPQALREELDFRVEARNMAAVAAADGRAVIAVPAPHQALCTERVLVMQRLDGRAARPRPARTRRPRPRRRARWPARLLDSLLRQVLLAASSTPTRTRATSCCSPTGGWPARLRLGRPARRGRSARRCSGCCWRWTGATRWRSATRCWRSSPRPDEIDEAALERALGAFLARHLGPGGAAGVRMFADLFRIVADYGLAVPPAVAAVFRALATVEGTLAALAPGFDVVAEARRFAGRAVRRAVGRTRVAATAGTTSWSRCCRCCAGCRGGSTGSRPRSSAAGWRSTSGCSPTSGTAGTATGLVHQVLLTVLGATAGLMAVLLLGTTGGPAVTTRLGLYQLLGYFLLVISSVLVLRVLVLIFRRDT